MHAHILDHQVDISLYLTKSIALPYTKELACSRTISVHFYSHKPFDFPNSKINFIYLGRPRIEYLDHIFEDIKFKEVGLSSPKKNNKTKTFHQNLRYLLALSN